MMIVKIMMMTMMMMIIQIMEIMHENIPSEKKNKKEKRPSKFATGNKQKKILKKKTNTLLIKIYDYVRNN